MADRIVSADDYANAVDATLARFGVTGRGVHFGVWRKEGKICIGIDAQPTDDDMRFVCDRLIEQFDTKVEAAILNGGQGLHAFLFSPAYVVDYGTADSGTLALPTARDTVVDNDLPSTAQSAAETPQVVVVEQPAPMPETKAEMRGCSKICKLAWASYDFESMMNG